MPLVGGSDMIVEQLVEANEVKLDSKDYKQWTPLLHVATYNGHMAVVELLFKRGAHHDARDSYGRTSLLCAAGCGHRAIAKLLLNEGHSSHSETSAYHEMSLLHAAEEGHEEEVKQLATNGVSLIARDQFGQTPLSCAVAHDHSSTVKFILNQSDHRRCLESKDINSRTSLHCAANGRIQISATEHSRNSVKEETIRILLNSAIDIDAKDNNGLTALHSAIIAENKYTAQLLVSKGAALDSQDDKGRTPLSYAVGGFPFTSSSLIKLLLESGAQPDLADHCGQTALSHAVESMKSKEVVELSTRTRCRSQIKGLSGSVAAFTRRGFTKELDFCFDAPTRIKCRTKTSE